MAEATSSFGSYLLGGISVNSFTNAYLIGGGSTSGNIPGYLTGVEGEEDSISAFIEGTGAHLSSVYAFLEGVERSSLGAFLDGTITGDDSVANDYIWLKSSDNSIAAKFRVLARDYDDGTPEKAQSTKRTLGGGLSHSAGGIYYAWHPTIRVRHNETEADYGNIQDLVDLFELNNPNGTPSNVITFIDHHNQTHLVLMPGSLKKAYLGSEIEGSEAWALVSLTLQEWTNA